MTGLPDDSSPAMRPYACALADGIDAALPAWVEASVLRLMTDWAGKVPPEVAADAAAAARRAHDEVMPRLRALLAADIDEQQSTPLAIVRSAVAFATEVLAGAGVPLVQRDDFAVRAFPRDDYNLAPATFADLDPSLAETALEWGAAKAFEHKQRHGGRQQP